MSVVFLFCNFPTFFVGCVVIFNIAVYRQVSSHSLEIVARQSNAFRQFVLQSGCHPEHAVVVCVSANAIAVFNAHIRRNFSEIVTYSQRNRYLEEICRAFFVAERMSVAVYAISKIHLLVNISAIVIIIANHI